MPSVDSHPHLMYLTINFLHTRAALVQAPKFAQKCGSSPQLVANDGGDIASRAGAGLRSPRDHGEDNAMSSSNKCLPTDVKSHSLILLYTVDRNQVQYNSKTLPKVVYRQ